MIQAKPDILIYGYGNPGRQDDGLGVVFIDTIREWIEEKSLKYIILDQNYQLNVEDALAISDKDIVVFVDASQEDISDFKLEKISAANRISFSTHSMHPQSIIGLCQELYARKPLTFILTIKGYQWQLQEGLSEQAQNNLHKAIEFLKGYLMDPARFLSY